MQLTLHKHDSQGVTVLSNLFIDHYMPKANGEFVKIYLYLYRCLSNGQEDVSVSVTADLMSCTESDILRAIRYWEGQRLMVLSGNDQAISIDFLEPVAADTRHTDELHARMAASRSSCGTGAEHVQQYPSVSAGSEHAQPYASASVGSEHVQQQHSASSCQEEKQPKRQAQKPLQKLSPDRVRELQQNEEVRQILFIAEQYMGPLNRSVTDDLLYIYEELHFSFELMDYLIEYCVSKGSGNIHYIKKVAFHWYENQIDTVAKAKKETSTYHRDYFTLLKAFGITGRNPVSSEVDMMKHWIQDYGFTMDILTEACTRTVASTGKASFAYADKILSGWKKKGVRHLKDVEALDTLHKQMQINRNEQKKKTEPQKSSSNKFGNFEQRSYDYNALESQLLESKAP